MGRDAGRTVAARLKAAIRETTGLTASAGVAPNKFLAKIASGWKKPDGLTVIAPERVERFLQGLPIDALWGVGPVTAARLRSTASRSWWTSARSRKTTSDSSSGAWRRGCNSSSNGIDDRKVEPNRETKSASSENTFDRDLTDLAEIETRSMTWRATSRRWLAKDRRLARTVTIKVRYNDFTTVTRSHTAAPTRDPMRSRRVPSR